MTHPKQKKYAGITSRGNSIQIEFTYRGVRCRESVRVKPTATALKEMSRKRDVIMYQIEMGNFDFTAHFPNSKNRFRFSDNAGSFISVEDLLKNWLKAQEKHCEHSTMRGYSSVVYYHLIPSFKNMLLTDVTTQKINDFIDTLDCSPKRINNILSPLRAAYKDAFYEGFIEKNPLDRIRSMTVTNREPKPFTRSEVDTILLQLDDTPTKRNLLQFAFASGLRTSELIALRWTDIDFDNHRFYVRRALVYKREKTTKTASGIRTVPLNDDSKAALNSQLQFKSANNDFIFFDGSKPWSDASIRRRIWIPAIEASGLEYRNPYQTRHTYASHRLSSGVNPMQVAAEMGHADWGMIRSIYGRWIPDH